MPTLLLVNLDPEKPAQNKAAKHDFVALMRNKAIVAFEVKNTPFNEKILMENKTSSTVEDRITH